MTMNKTSVASASSSSSSTTPSTHGLRTQLGHLLPKHALFQVHLHIEQLSNVPLVSGQFGVRWKFKNVHSGSGLLSKMKHRSASSPSVIGAKKDKGKGRADLDDTAEEDEQEPPRSSSETFIENATTPVPSSNSSTSAVYGQFLTASPQHTPQPPAAIPSAFNEETPSPPEHSVARGMTEWVPLRHYNAKWDHHVNIIVQMDVHRETGDLLPCELKLVAMQRVIQGDLNSPQRPRLGAVYLNLAEYANAGPVSRRYLLRESKTNATLKLMIEVDWLGGEKNYTPPPLRKGEIMASVTGLLSNSDLFHTQLARDLDLYTREDDEDWADKPAGPYSTGEGLVDFDRLAFSDGLRTTETLIDALFNPVPTASEAASPFTYYDPQRAKELERQVWASERESTHSSLESSLTGGSGTGSGSGSGSGSGNRTPSVYTAGSEHSSSTGQDHHHRWWRKIRTRSSTPGTPTTRQQGPSDIRQSNQFARVPS